MPTYPSLDTRIIGQAEKALNAILARLLAGTGLTEPQWVILTLAVTSGGTIAHEQFTGMVASALKGSDGEAQARVGDMVTAHWLRDTGDGSAVMVTGSARDLHSRIRAAITEITQRLWGDLPPEDLATAGRVLTIITERADAELAAH